MYFSFQSFAHPITIFSYDPENDDLRILERMDVKVDLDRYETRQVWFTSKDGTRVPMFVIHRRDLKLDGKNPTILYGYGGFDIALNPTFNRGIFPWLDAGGVYAVANLRGGGEFGKEWHLAGRLDKKQNVFDDMIAAAEKLVSEKFTSADRLGCYGGSNGGLLIGAMVTQRPDLFRAAISAVPLLDMIRYHNFSIARLWIPEYGSAADANEFRTLWAYSPYHKVKPGTAYPATLFTTAESDSRVDPMHARKMAAAMQAAQTAKDRPILLWVETKAGHGAGKPLKKVIDQQVDNYTFFMWQLGMLNGNS
jgi:prolyl oligopeptidase